eukprot:7400828-Karenia_brevis.AAC.1
MQIAELQKLHVQQRCRIDELVDLVLCQQNEIHQLGARVGIIHTHHEIAQRKMREKHDQLQRSHDSLKEQYDQCSDLGVQE